MGDEDDEEDGNDNEVERVRGLLLALLAIGLTPWKEESAAEKVEKEKEEEEEDSISTPPPTAGEEEEEEGENIIERNELDNAARVPEAVMPLSSPFTSSCSLAVDVVDVVVVG